MSTSAKTVSGSDDRSNASSISTLDDIAEDKDKTVTIHVKGINVPTSQATSPDAESSVVKEDDVTERITLVTNYLRQESLYLPVQTTRERVTWHPENRSHRLVRKDHADGNENATLMIIAVISTDSFFLTPDAYYKGSTQVNASLADVKLSCLLRRPVDTPLATDFTSALTNILWMMEQMRTPGLPRIGVTMPTGSMNPVFIKLRHVLFKAS
jgi:hypothetical protein